MNKIIEMVWVEIEEGCLMPEEGEEVIVAAEDGAFVVSATYRGGDFYDIVKDVYDGYFETMTRDVTHWMKKPKSPKDL